MTRFAAILLCCLSLSASALGLIESGRKIAPPAPASQLLTNIKQEKSIVDRAMDILIQDKTIQARLASGTEVLGVYDSGMRYRCDCYDMLVKFKNGPRTWIETVKVAEGKATWLK